MIDHKRAIVTDDDLRALRAQLYPEHAGRVSLYQLGEDCVRLGASPIAARDMWDDCMLVYFLAWRMGLIVRPDTSEEA